MIDNPAGKSVEAQVRIVPPEFEGAETAVMAVPLVKVMAVSASSEGVTSLIVIEIVVVAEPPEFVARIVESVAA